MDRLGRPGERERQRDGEEDMATVGWKMRSVYVCVRGLRGWNAHTRTHMHAHTRLASSGLVLVSCPWLRRAQESAVSLWRIDTDTPYPSAPDTPKPPPPSLNPSSPLPPSSSSAAGPCLVGMFERRRIEEGVEAGGAGLHLDCGLY